MNKFLLKLFCLFICFSVSISIFGQKDFQHQKDSLKKVIAATQGKEKLDAYFKLEGVYFDACREGNFEMDALIEFYKEYEAEAVRQKSMNDQELIKINTVSSYSNVHNYKKVIELSPEYLSFMKKNELWTGYYKTYSILINAYLRENSPQYAIEKTQQMYDEAKQRNHDVGKSLALFQMGSIYLQMDRLEEAETYLEEALELLKTNDELKGNTLQAYYNLIDVLILMEKFDEAFVRAKEYEALVIRFYENLYGEAGGYWYLWIMYRDLYCASGDYDKAEDYCNKLSSLGNSIANYGNYKAFAQIYASRKQFDKALAYVEKMIEIQKDDIYYLAECLSIKVEILCEMKGVPEIYEIFEDIVEMNNAVLDMEYNAQLDELRTQYEVDKHIAEKERNRNYFLFALGGCVLLLFVLGIWISYSRAIVKKNRGLYLQIKEQDRLASELEAMTKQYEEVAPAVEEETQATTVGTLRATSLPGTRQQRQFVSRLRDYLVENKYYTTYDIDIQELTSKMATNRTSLFEALKAVAGKTPMEFINDLRLDEAKRLLDDSNLTIETIAIECGFYTSRTFYRQFRERYRISPTEYRKIAGEQN